jgi:hypothetical protein
MLQYVARRVRAQEGRVQGKLRVQSSRSRTAARRNPGRAHHRYPHRHQEGHGLHNVARRYKSVRSFQISGNSTTSSILRK